MKITPNSKRLLIERLAPEAPKSSIVIPETALRRNQHFRVIAVGPDVDIARAGDVIIMGQYAGTEIELEGGALMFVHVDEVLGVVK